MKRLLLVLDLDETLVHARTHPHYAHDFQVFEYRVRKRPYLAEFLQVCFAHFDVAVWTSSSEEYGAEVVRQLFPEPEKLKFFWAREQCTYCWDAQVRDFVWAKRLQKIRGQPLQRILVIDDSVEKFRSAPGNVLLVPPFFGDMEDTELLRLAIRLPEFRDLPDVRKPTRGGWPWR